MDGLGVGGPLWNKVGLGSLVVGSGAWLMGEGLITLQFVFFTDKIFHNKN